MVALGVILIATGLLVAGLAPVAFTKVAASRRWADAVSALRESRLAELSELEGVPPLAAVRGVVGGDDVVSDALTSAPAVWFEVEVSGPEDRRFPMVISDGRPFFLRDGDAVAEVDPRSAALIDVRRDEWNPDDDRERVAAFLKSHGLANRADIHIEHRVLAPDAKVVVIGRPRVRTDLAVPGPSGATGGYRGERQRVYVFEGTADAPLTITTSTLEAFVERELASAKTSLGGVIALALLGAAITVAGVVALLV